MSYNDICFSYGVLQEEVEPLLFMARDKGLQIEKIALIQSFFDRCERERIAAILVEDEISANCCLGLGAVARALAYELEMYICLKEDEPEQAWEKLIYAQDMISAAARACPDITNLDAKFQHLRQMEEWFFPPQSFFSAGLIVREQYCSICLSDYEKCDHIAGRPYMGRFCTIRLNGISADHIAYVESPADRRCRLTSFSVPEGERNSMSWVVTSKKDEADHMKVIIAKVSPENDAISEPSQRPLD